MIKPTFSASEIATVRDMTAAGCGRTAIAAFLGRSKNGVARYIPAEDDHNRWDAAPPRDPNKLRARWEKKMPAMRAAMRKAGAAP
jgi:hypothetical protein